jgi:hypothetical protein
MGQFFKVNGDYNIKTAEGAKITLDTGPAASGGSVRITGDLVVEGQTLNVAAANLNITDNIIRINDGETGAGITLVYSGLEVERGSLSNASLLYDETADTWLIANNSAPGPFNYDESNLRLRRIYTNPTTDDGDLTLIGTGTGLVKVFGTTTYEAQILAREAAVPGSVDDVLPNKKYVDDAILNNPTFQIVAPQSQDTRVIITDKEITPNLAATAGSLQYFNTVTGYSTSGESAVSVIVDNTLVGQFYNNRLEISDLEIGGGIDSNEITTKNGITNLNVYVRTQGTGKLQTNYAIQLEKTGVVPTYVSDNILLYGDTPGTGTSGVWFVNDSAEAAKQNGELISKNRALVFSMLF